jgi:hypothetical protein
MTEEVISIIENFAEKYNFIQEIDIENYIFDIEKFKALDGKNFIIVNGSNVEIGKLSINLRTDDEGEVYHCADKEILFSFNWFFDDILLETIETMCKKYNLLA